MRLTDATLAEDDAGRSGRRLRPMPSLGVGSILDNTQSPTLAIGGKYVCKNSEVVTSNKTVDRPPKPPARLKRKRYSAFGGGGRRRSCGALSDGRDGIVVALVAAAVAFALTSTVCSV
mmetsp:Transcript_9663/g.19516  ORF Transcript_9663/g.19516 Transcript_9663/m.19516 type:complete len:118 (-) Transcript_9663:666-1019(-)